MKIIKINANDVLPKNYTGIVELRNGTKFWYLNGLRHREDGPAVELPNGDKRWYLNGKIHREDGPAIEWSNGHREYWTDGEPLNKEKIEQLIKLDYPESTAIKLSSFTNGKT